LLAAAAGLIDKSLLLQAESSVPARPLYCTLETVRAYAAIELNAAGERDDAMEGLVRYCATESRLAAEGLVDHAQGEWLDRVRDDLENYRSVLIWLIERGRSVEASTIVYRLFFFWVIRGHASEGLEWYERILAVPSPPPSVEATALIGAAVMRYTQAEFEKSRAAATRALALASEPPTAIGLRSRNCCSVISNISAETKRRAQPLCAQPSRVAAIRKPWRIGQRADRHGACRDGDRRFRGGGPAAPRGLPRSFRAADRGSCYCLCSFEPRWRSGGATPMRQWRSCGRASGRSASCTTSSPSSTRSFRWRPRRH
jgi:hypothetical protein